MEKMSEVIRKGIEAAEHDLVQDSNDILMEEVSNGLRLRLTRQFLYSVNKVSLISNSIQVIKLSSVDSLA